MYTNSKIAKSIRVALALGVASATLMSPAAIAQQTQPGADNNNVEKISVTGSRVQRVNMVSSSPVTEITAEEIRMSGLTRVEDILNDMPALFAAQTAQPVPQR
jgi:outer membrane receptor for ferrienterochelin and colicin